jgi:hypothetical protein
MKNPYILSGEQFKLLTEVDEKGGKGRKAVPSRSLIEKYGQPVFYSLFKYHLDHTLSGVRITATGRRALEQYQL